MYTKINWFLCLIVICFFESTFGTREPLIFGGETVKPGSQKHLVKLHIRKQLGEYICSGSIVESYWILTAAHCFFPEPTVTSVSHFTNGKSKYIAKVDTYHIHPDYVDSEEYTYEVAKNDIALVKTKNKIKFDNYVRPIPLAYSHFMNKTKGIISGYGDSEFPHGVEPRETEVRLIYCIPEVTTICSLGNLKKPGHGDSGGPLVISGRLAGVTSGGCKYPYKAPCYNYYANVAEHIRWIKGIVL